MSVYNPEDLDYDKELFDRISSVGKDVLVRFYNLHSDTLNTRPLEESAHSKRELRQIIAGKLKEQMDEFLKDYEQLREESVRASPAIEYIAEHFDIEAENLDVDTRYELLILLHEEGLDEVLDQLVVRSKMRTYSASRNYILSQRVELDEVEERLLEFHEGWNQGNEDNDPVRVKIEFESENLMILKIFQEVGPQSPQTFEFREENIDEIPVVPELTTISYHQLKTMRIQIEVRDSETELVFSESFTSWRNLLPDLFEGLFRIDEFFEEIDEVRSEVASDIEENMVEAIDTGDDPVETARETISERQQEAESEVDHLDIPESRKQNLKERINSISISGSEITEDQSIETQEFRLIAGLEGLFRSVDIEEGFKDMIEKADSEKQSFVLTVDERPVELNDGKWSKLGTGQLRDLDRRALEIFFDSEVEL